MNTCAAAQDRTRGAPCAAVTRCGSKFVNAAGSVNIAEHPLHAKNGVRRVSPRGVRTETVSNVVQRQIGQRKRAVSGIARTLGARRLTTRDRRYFPSVLPETGRSNATFSDSPSPLQSSAPATRS